MVFENPLFLFFARPNHLFSLLETIYLFGITHNRLVIPFQNSSGYFTRNLFNYHETTTAQHFHPLPLPLPRTLPLPLPLPLPIPQPPPLGPLFGSSLRSSVIHPVGRFPLVALTFLPSPNPSHRRLCIVLLSLSHRIRRQHTPILPRPIHTHSYSTHYYTLLLYAHILVYIIPYHRFLPFTPSTRLDVFALGRADTQISITPFHSLSNSFVPTVPGI